MENQALLVEYIYNAPIEKVWKALTDMDQMKEWYFAIQAFAPERGFKFEFSGGDENVQFLHRCEVMVADAPNKLSYSWTYPEYEGYSVVTFELFKVGTEQTRLKLTHEGLNSFPKDNPNFAVTSFAGGWNFILGESLKNYVETSTISKSVSIKAPAEVIWIVLLNPNNQWAKAFGDGVLVKTDWEPGSEVVWMDTEGNIGARGIVKNHEHLQFLQVDMFDDVQAGTETGDYSEQYILSAEGEGQGTLTIEAGPLSNKYIPDHAKMWDEAIQIIKELSEK